MAGWVCIAFKMLRLVEKKKLDCRRRLQRSFRILEMALQQPQKQLNQEMGFKMENH
jgi:hypothetical protein